MLFDHTLYMCNKSYAISTTDKYMCSNGQEIATNECLFKLFLPQSLQASCLHPTITFMTKHQAVKISH